MGGCIAVGSASKVLRWLGEHLGSRDVQPVVPSHKIGIYAPWFGRGRELSDSSEKSSSDRTISEPIIVSTADAIGIRSTKMLMFLGSKSVLNDVS
jgi:hypothetical protein